MAEIITNIDKKNKNNNFTLKITYSLSWKIVILYKIL